MSQFKVDARPMQLYRAKRKVMDELEGNHGEAYILLPKYANEIFKSNPGSIMKLERDLPSMTFKRIFMSLEAMQYGFKNGCRGFIGLDGCHLKTLYGGVLLFAIALDGNNGHFPLAMAVVENEGKENWKSFLQELQTFVELGQDRHICFMSDQQKIKTSFITSRAYNDYTFNEAMRQMREVSREAYNWVLRIDVYKWSRHAFSDQVKSNHVTNNFSESFNNWVGKLRYKHILVLLDGSRSKLMSRLLMGAEKASTWVGLVTLNIREKFNKLIDESRSCNVTPAGQDEYEVINEEGKHIVKLRSRSCDCRGWQISGLPCKHATVAITHKRTYIEQYCDPYFYNETYMRTHSSMIHPIPDQRMWTPVHCNPVEPLVPRKKPGRPKKARTRDADEPAATTSDARKSKSLQCSHCEEFGHNKRTCKMMRPTSATQFGCQSSMRNIGRKATASTNQVGRECATSNQSKSTNQAGRGYASSRSNQAGKGIASTNQPRQGSVTSNQPRRPNAVKFAVRRGTGRSSQSGRDT
ncbi:uncharacterized protein LOC132295849 [Cornus florida]|uniref:uncharacterized protein LOC132295849 n=1 Tax=Cornus florida TaxID=4283 RepID=UPI00289BD957|nr:uncharacterized protein LOC132295849 [Cornus florida]